VNVAKPSAHVSASSIVARSRSQQRDDGPAFHRYRVVPSDEALPLAWEGLPLRKGIPLLRRRAPSVRRHSLEASVFSRSGSRASPERCDPRRIEWLTIRHSNDTEREEVVLRTVKNTATVDFGWSRFGDEPDCD
jgi:hypothetical protein